MSEFLMRDDAVKPIILPEPYETWVKANVHGKGYGQCADITALMAEAFPELTRVRGHYYCPFWGPREHWWTVTQEGATIDPTRMQFPSLGHGVYEPWDELQPEPTGKCANCGRLCYGGDECCSQECETAYAAYRSEGF